MTAQIPDSIRVEGRSYPLFSYPLMGFFGPDNPAPNFCATSSANWSGHRCSWALIDDKLFLTGLTGTVCRIKDPAPGNMRSWCRVDHQGECDITKITMSSLFGPSDEPVHATWHTGELRIPTGRRIKYVHQGFGSQFEGYLFYAIRNGNVAGSRWQSGEDYENELQAERVERKHQNGWISKILGKLRILTE